MRRITLFVFLAVLFSQLPLLNAQSLSIVSGNGQVVQENFPTVSPLVVRASDAAGRPLTDVPITFAVSEGQGGLTQSLARTDPNGLASTTFVGTSIQPGTSFTQATVTATSAVGAANFFVITSALRSSNGASIAPPAVQLEAPLTYVVSGQAGTTIPGALRIRVVALGGISQGQGIPNVGVRIVPTDTSPNPPAGACNAPGGVALTDQTGLATCDLVLNRNVGTSSFVALVGEFQNTPRIALTITAGEDCTYSLSPISQSFASNASTGTVSVTTGAGCAFTASSNASFITVTSGANVSGPGTVSYSVAANTTGVTRTGTLTIAGLTVTITQSAGSTVGTPLAFTTAATLPSATTALPYSVNLSVSGGTPPYNWIPTTILPPGLTLNSATGILSGAVSTAGTYTFGVTLSDALGASVSQTFSLIVSGAAGGSGLQITTTAFPAGSIGVTYQQAIAISTGCSSNNPFAGPPTVSLAAGSLPTGLFLAATAGGFGIAGIPTTAGNFTFSLRATDACGGSAIRDFTITIGGAGGPTSPAITASPSALAFAVQAGSAVTPLAQNLVIDSGGTPLQFGVSVTTVNGGNWLSVTPSNGTTPSVLIVGIVNGGFLAAGTYAGSIIVTSQASSSPLTIPVTLTVNAPPIQTIAVAPTALSFDVNASTGPLAPQRQLQVTSTSPGIRFNVTALTFSGGNWLIVTPGAAEAPAIITVTANAAGLSSGTYNGSVSLTPVGNSAAAVTVGVVLNVTSPSTATVSPGVLNFTVSSGTPPPPQSLTVSSTGAPVNFSVSANVPWIGIASVDGITPDVLSISVNPAGLQVGANSGTITILPEPTRIPLTVPVNVTLTQPIPIVTAISNAASFAPGPVAPGEIVTLFGTSLGGADLLKLRITSDNRLDTGLGDTRVLFDDIAAPLIYVSAEQVSAIVPYELYGRSTTRVVLQRGNVQTNPREVRVVDAVPGIFTLNANGQGAILNQDSTVNGAQNGAEPGSVISIFATGEGQTNPSGVNGRITPAVVSELAFPLLPVTAQIGGQRADVLYAGSAPELPAGMLQVNVRVPAGVSRNSAVPVLITVGGFSSQPGVTVAIR